jgi:hypothetical protein
MTDTSIKLRFGRPVLTERSKGSITYRFMMDGSPISPHRFRPLQDWLPVYHSGRGEAYFVVGSWGQTVHHLFMVQELIRPLPPAKQRQLEYIEFKYSLNVTPRPHAQGVRKVGLALTRAKQPMSYPLAPLFQPPRVIKVPVLKPLELYSPEYITPSNRRSRTEADWLTYLSNHSKAFEKRRERVRNLRSDRYKRKEKEIARITIVNKTRLDLYKATFEKRMTKYKKRLAAYNVAYQRSLRPQFVKAIQHKDGGILPDHKFKLMKLVPIGQPKYVTSTGADGTGPWPPVNVRGEFLFTKIPGGRNDPYSNGGSTPQSLPLAWPFQTTPWPYVTEHVNQFAGRQDYWDDSQRTDVEALLRNEAIMHGLHTQIADAADMNLHDVDTQLIRKIYSKLRRNVVHVGNLVAERKQTFDMIVTVARRIQKLISLKRSVLSEAGKAAMNPKHWANEVLAFKFGVEPLINDFQALRQFLETSDPDTLVVTVRTNSGSPQALSFRTNGIEFTGMIEVSYVIKMRATNEIFNTLNSFGLINPAEILWEVSPWSFVLDWFVPMGQWIASLTADHGLEFVTGTRKVKLRGTFTIGASEFNPKDPTFSRASFEGFQGTFAGEVVSRTVLYQLPDRDRIFEVKSPWSLSHGIEALALFVQKIKR